MSIEKIKDRLIRQSIKDSDWMNEAKYRIDNQKQLDVEFKNKLKNIMKN